MNKDIELAIDIAAFCMICEMHPNAVPPLKLATAFKILQGKVLVQPSAELLLNAIFEKYGIAP